MSNSIPRERIFRLSLRAMLVLVALVALATASLTYASDVWLALAAAVTIIACFLMLIVAVVDRGRRQAFAIGFSLVAIGYWAVVVNGARSAASSGSSFIELDFSFGRLPTTVLLQNLYSAVRKTYWIDPNTRKVIPGYDPATSQTSVRGGSGRRQFSPGPFMANEPKREDFMAIGHCWWTLVLGYCGGQFGRFVYARRTREGEKQV